MHIIDWCSPLVALTSNPPKMKYTGGTKQLLMYTKNNLLISEWLNWTPTCSIALPKGEISGTFPTWQESRPITSWKKETERKLKIKIFLCKSLSKMWNKINVRPTERKWGRLTIWCSSSINNPFYSENWRIMN